MSIGRSSVAGVVIVFGLCSARAAQDPPKPTPAPTPQVSPTPPTPTISDRDRAQAEMRELFAKVERRLMEIDRLLSDAGAGDAPVPAGAKKSGIDELLRNSQTREREVLEGIDRILELARENQSRSSSSGNPSGDPQSGGKSPLDKQGEQENEREQTPSAPKPGEKPDSKDASGSKPKPDKPKPDPGDGEPRDPRASPTKNAKNTPGGAPPAQPTEGPSKADNGKDRWGDLPVKVRDIFRAEGGGDMPVQYREWIDSYYRRLNKKP
jgi:hypothetical protein